MSSHNVINIILCLKEVLCKNCRTYTRDIVKNKSNITDCLNLWQNLSRNKIHNGLHQMLLSMYLERDMLEGFLFYMDNS